VQFEREECALRQQSGAETAAQYCRRADSPVDVAGWWAGDVGWREECGGGGQGGGG